MLNYQVLTKKLLKIKHLLVESELSKLKTFDSNNNNIKIYFEGDRKPNYLIFQPISRYFKIIANTKYISSWESKGLSNESITPYATSANSLTPIIEYYGSKIRLKFNKSCLKQSNNLKYDYRYRVNVYITWRFWF